MLEDLTWQSKRMVGRIRRVTGSIALRGWRATFSRVVEAIGRAVASRPDGETVAAVTRPTAVARSGRRMLVIDTSVPVPSRDSGSLRLQTMLQLLCEEGWDVDFFADDGDAAATDVARLAGIGVNLPGGSFLKWLRANGASLEVAMLCRVPIASQYGRLIRRHAPQARLVFDTVDLHYLREQRAADLLGRPALQRQAAATRRKELALIRDSDLCLVVSEDERSILGKDLPGTRVELLSNIHEVFGRQADFAQRRDIVFVGGFGHPPNLDAMQWFVRDVLPLLRREEPGLVLHVIGDANAEARRSLTADGVRVHGRVEDIAPFMNSARVSVAPLRFGAGVKGKVNMAMSYGLPVVVTSIAAEGMHLTDGVDALIADEATAFAQAVMRAYRDPTLWRCLSDGGLRNVEANFSFDVARRTIRSLLPANGGA